jgi:hypothetical protein
LAVETKKNVRIPPAQGRLVAGAEGGNRLTREPDPKTEELKLQQARREESEQRRAEHSETEDEAYLHARRAEKSAYLKQKLDERAKSERDSGD